ncbi:MAG: hypothetical protein EP346_01200 [Bacteroidetes bacterium]|nr:MAG: hypothetical protein EP346_01200 [Bacteroidota bacterium]
MGMNFAGAVIKDGITSPLELANVLGRELELVEETVLGDEPFLDVEEDQFAVIQRNGCTTLYFDYDFLGEDINDFSEIFAPASEAVFYMIGETAGAYIVEWYENGKKVSTDEYQDADIYHVNGPNKLGLTDADVYFSGIRELIDDWSGGWDESYPAFIYRLMPITKKTVTQVIREELVRQSGSLATETEIDERCTQILESIGHFSRASLIAFCEEIQQFYKVVTPPALGFYKGVKLSTRQEATPLQMRHMFIFVERLTSRGETKGGLTDENSSEMGKVVRYLGVHLNVLKSFPDKSMVDQTIAEIESNKEIINLATVMSTRTGEDLKVAFRKLYNKIVDHYVYGYSMQTNPLLKERSIAELKKGIYFNVHGRPDGGAPNSAAVTRTVIPNIHELLVRGIRMDDVLDGSFDPNTKENQIKGRVEGKTVAIGVVGVLIIIRLLFGLFRLMA